MISLVRPLFRFNFLPPFHTFSQLAIPRSSFTQTQTKCPCNLIFSLLVDKMDRYVLPQTRLFPLVSQCSSIHTYAITELYICIGPARTAKKSKVSLFWNEYSLEALFPYSPACSVKMSEYNRMYFSIRPLANFFHVTESHLSSWIRTRVTYVYIWENHALYMASRHPHFSFFLACLYSPIKMTSSKVALFQHQPRRWVASRYSRGSRVTAKLHWAWNQISRGYNSHILYDGAKCSMN